MGLNTTTAGGNEQSATLRVHQDDFSLYNIDVVNSWGKAGNGGQALALSTQNERAAFYGSAFYGYQDTILVNSGTSVFLSGLIEVSSYLLHVSAGSETDFDM
jgi:pectinesterase